MRKLQVQYGFRSFAVVAHSMGGLVSRGFLQRYREGGGAAAVPLFVSISTPWDGHKAAEYGAKSPVPVRVWIDMAPGSAYLKSIYEKDPGVPHYLLFTFRQGRRVARRGERRRGDGGEPAARRPRSKGAVRVEGFNETHMSVLESRRGVGAA